MKEKSNDIKSVLSQKKLKDALLKKALGYDCTETVTEYVSDEDGVKLSKKKVTKKNVPPDITALKMLLTENDKDLSEMSDEELQKEKARLIKLLAEKGEE